MNELLDLGLKVLKIPEYKVDAALNNKKDIQLTAHKALTTWFNSQENRQEAYANLLSGLRVCEFNQLASTLQQWVEGPT